MVGAHGVGALEQDQGSMQALAGIDIGFGTFRDPTHGSWIMDHGAISGEGAGVGREGALTFRACSQKAS